jgi:uncharacterized protein HemY
MKNLEEKTHEMILIAFIIQVAMVFFLWLGVIFFPRSFLENSRSLATNIWNSSKNHRSQLDSFFS